MRYILIFYLVQQTFSVLAQEGVTLVFSYDNTGKLIERKIQVIPQVRLERSVAKKDSVTIHENHVTIFPNPASDELTIKGDLPAHVNRADILVLSMSAQLLIKDLYEGMSKCISIKDLARGIYIVEIRAAEEVIMTFKLIIN